MFNGDYRTKRYEMKPERCNACLTGPHADIIESECIPAPWFGALSNCVAVATIGLNPALNEWQRNRQWRPIEQRLSILSDFNIVKRGELSDDHLIEVQNRRAAYFTNQPHSYFTPLESLLRCVHPAWSYHTGTAIHIDLVACATGNRWGDLPANAKAAIKTNCREHLRGTLRRLPAETILLLNGESVRDGLLESEVSAGGSSRNDYRREIPGAPGTAGFTGNVSQDGRLLRYCGWSTPISKTTGPVALAIALWVRQLTVTPRSLPGTLPK